MTNRVPATRIAEIAGYSEDWVRKLARAGKIPGAVNLNGHWRFHEPTFRAWQKRREEEQCQSIDAAVHGGSAFKPPALKSDDPLAQALSAWQSNTNGN